MRSTRKGPHKPRLAKSYNTEVVETKSDSEIRYGHPVRYTQCQCSTAHTYGNVTAFIQNWLINLFPPDFFRTIHVNSKIAHTQMRSTPKEYLKKSPPMFIIKPRIDWDDERFLKGSLMTERQYDIYQKYAGTNLEDFFIDNKNKAAIKYQLNRDVLYFDVILIFDTFMKQMNWAKYFQNSTRIKHPFMLETYLESYLSPELLKALSDCVGVPFIGPDGTSKDFMKYINANSNYPITYKLQGSSGTEEYYRYYPARIEAVIDNFNVDEGTKVGHIADRYQINFTMRCEFYSTGFYYLFSDKLVNINTITVDNDSSTIVPMFTDVLTKDDIDLPLGWHLFASPSCRLEDVDDTVDISSIFNRSINECIKFHRERGIPLMEFLKIRIRKQGKMLNEGDDYTIDKNFVIKFKNGSIYHTYKIIIMINADYINTLIKQVYNLK